MFVPVIYSHLFVRQTLTIMKVFSDEILLIEYSLLLFTQTRPSVQCDTVKMASLDLIYSFNSPSQMSTS